MLIIFIWQEEDIRKNNLAITQGWRIHL